MKVEDNKKLNYPKDTIITITNGNSPSTTFSNPFDKCIFSWKNGWKRNYVFSPIILSKETIYLLARGIFFCDKKEKRMFSHSVEIASLHTHSLYDIYYIQLTIQYIDWFFFSFQFPFYIFVISKEMAIARKLGEN